MFDYKTPEKFFEYLLSDVEPPIENLKKTIGILTIIQARLFELAKAEGCHQTLIWYQYTPTMYSSFRFNLEGDEVSENSRIFNCVVKHIEGYQVFYAILNRDAKDGDEIFSSPNIVDAGPLVFKDLLDLLN